MALQQSTLHPAFNSTIFVSDPYHCARSWPCEFRGLVTMPSIAFHWIAPIERSLGTSSSLSLAELLLQWMRTQDYSTPTRTFSDVPRESMSSWHRNNRESLTVASYPWMQTRPRVSNLSLLTPSLQSPPPAFAHFKLCFNKHTLVLRLKPMTSTERERLQCHCYSNDTGFPLPQPSPPSQHTGERTFPLALLYEHRREHIDNQRNSHV